MRGNRSTTLLFKSAGPRAGALMQLT